MENYLKAVTVIFIGLYFTITEAYPNQSPNKNIAPSYCDHSLEDQNLPHESDCSKYYRCVYGKKVPKICPDKMLFNVNIGNCDLYYNVECLVEKVLYANTHREQHSEEAIEHISGKTFVTTKNKLVTAINDDRSTFAGNSATITKPSDTVTTKFVYIPHEFDQRAYYKIENGEKRLLYCEERMVFSIEMEICARP